jgi:hypothetical protein
MESTRDKLRLKFFYTYVPECCRCKFFVPYHLIQLSEDGTVACRKTGKVYLKE